MRNFAKRLMAYEANGEKPAEDHAPPMDRICEKLRPALSMLMGKSGFRALLSRALAVASAEIQWLAAVHIKADGSLEGLEELHAQLDAKEFAEGGVVLLAQLLGLLAAFVGENLTLRLVLEVWPKVPLDGLEFDNGGQNEKTK
ncbi:MAG TPA: hypothetical protein VFC44_14005 [Candidatus Saccharimonadales bacterium]|nr:hypothetical protein [Candidatus Saccharimonadales bacterium]